MFDYGTALNMCSIKFRYLGDTIRYNIVTDRLCSPCLLIARETALYINNGIPRPPPPTKPPV